MKKLENFLATDPTNISILADCAEQCLHHGDSRAREFCNRALEVDSSNPRALYTLGTVELSEQNFSVASDIFSALAISINDTAIRYNLGYAQLYAGNYQAAVDTLETDIAQQTPSPHEVLMVFAKASYHLGKIEQTTNSLNRYRELHPESAECLGYLALIHSDINEPEKAIEFANMALDIEPDNHEASLALAHGTLDTYKLEEAKELYQSILDTRPHSGRAFLGLGMTKMGLGDVASAETELIQCVEHMPGHIGSQNALGWVQIILGKLEDAEKTFSASLEVEPLFAESHGGLACIYVMNGEKEKAIKSAKLGRRLDANAFSPQFAEILLLSNEQSKEAIQNNMTDLLNQKITEDGPVLIDAMKKFQKYRGNQ